MSVKAICGGLQGPELRRLPGPPGPVQEGGLKRNSHQTGQAAGPFYIFFQFISSTLQSSMGLLVIDFLTPCQLVSSVDIRSTSSFLEGAPEWLSW